MKQININRQLLGIEDLLFGFGQVTQNRAGQSVTITKINVGNLPFDETQSLIQWAQNVNLAELGSMTDELQALYDSIDALNNLEDNLVALNTLAQAINCLNNLCTNLTKLQNIDTNMAKLQNIDTNMTKLQNIDTNMTKLQNIDTNMTKLSSIYSNMSMLQTVYDNMSSLNAINTNISSINTVNTNISSVNNVSSNIAALVNINSNIANLNTINTQIIPNLSEILLVDDYAAQVSADKTTVANDKASVASMKLAVETIYDTFDDRFLGTKTSDPTLDNDGNPLLDGAMYFNTSVNALKVYDLGNALWVTIPQMYLSGLLDITLTSITTGDILTWNGSKWINTRAPSFDSIKLNGGTSTSGTATWNNTEHTYDIVLNPNVTLQVGQEDLVYCKNNTASVIANGRPVMAVGTNGNSGNILVDLHDGTKANARRIVGIATEDLTANGYGFVTRNGKVRGLNTTGSLYGETWVNGDILYVKATGNLTNVEPADTALKMPIAFVIHAHTNGTLYVRTTGIDENHDRDLIATKVSKVTSTDNAIVRFDGINGVIQNSGVFIDDNGNVGIGTSTPNNKIQVYASSGWNKGIGVQSYNKFIQMSSDSSFGNDIFWDNLSYLRFSTGSTPDGTGYTERMRIDSAGNVGIGTVPNTITAGYKTLQIHGNAGVSLMSSSNDSHLSTNAYYNGGYLYQTTGVQATDYVQAGGNHYWKTAPSGTAGNAITWTNAMTLDNNGNLSTNSTILPYSATDSNGYKQANNNGIWYGRVVPFSSDGTMLLETQYAGNGGGFRFNIDDVQKMKLNYTGNLLVGTATDNGVDKLQVNGSISALPPSFGIQQQVNNHRKLYCFYTQNTNKNRLKLTISGNHTYVSFVLNIVYSNLYASADQSAIRAYSFKRVAIANTTNFSEIGTGLGSTVTVISSNVVTGGYEVVLGFNTEGYPQFDIEIVNHQYYSTGTITGEFLAV